MHGGAGHTASAIANLPVVAGRVGLRLVDTARTKRAGVDTGTRANTNAGRVLGGRVGSGWMPALAGGWT